MRDQRQKSVIVMLLGALIIAGCSNKNEERGKTVVVFWHSFVASTIPALDELVVQFEQEHPDIVIQAQYIPTGDALIQKLVAAVQSGTAPDISWIHTDFLDKLVEANALYPMSHFVDGPNGLAPEDLNDIFPASLEAGMYRDTLYALPMEATALALFYNPELFRMAGLDPEKPPQTWEELHQYAVRMTVDENNDGKTDRYGFFVPAFSASGPLNIWMNLQWTPFLWQAGGEELSQDGKQVLFNSNAGIAALTLWKKLYDDLDFGKFGLSHDLGFASGKIAMILDGPWDLPRFRELNLTWRVAPLPEGPVGRATYLAGEQLAIFRQSLNPDKAWVFVKWILDPRVQASFSINSGYLPVRRSTLLLPEYRRYLEKDHAMKVFVDQMAVGRARRIPDKHRVEVNRVLAEAIEQATIGGRDPRSALDDAAARANRLLTGK